MQWSTFMSPFINHSFSDGHQLLLVDRVIACLPGRQSCWSTLLSISINSRVPSWSIPSSSVEYLVFNQLVDHLNPLLILFSRLVDFPVPTRLTSCLWLVDLRVFRWSTFLSLAGRPVFPRLGDLPVSGWSTALSPCSSALVCGWSSLLHLAG